MIMNFISVAIGGALGAMMRYGVGLAISTSSLGLPAYVATLGVNVVGCALMGVMAAYLLHAPLLSAPLLSQSGRAFIMVGFLGALTTFSSFALDSFHLLEKQQYGVMVLYLLASFALSLGGFFTMYHLTRWGLS